MGAVWYGFDEKISGNMPLLPKLFSDQYWARWTTCAYGVGVVSYSQMGCWSHMHIRPYREAPFLGAQKPYRLGRSRDISYLGEGRCRPREERRPREETKSGDGTVIIGFGS